MRLLPLLLLAACAPVCPGGSDRVVQVAEAARAIPPMRWLWVDGTETVLYADVEARRCGDVIHGELTLHSEDGRLEELASKVEVYGNPVGDRMRWRLDVDKVDWEAIGGLDAMAVLPQDVERGSPFIIDKAYFDLNGIDEDIDGGRLETSGTFEVPGTDQRARTWRRLGEPRPLHR